jgi:hypothetical protein
LQVLAFAFFVVVSWLGFAIFITGWIGGELADVFKEEREVIFMIALLT